MDPQHSDNLSTLGLQGTIQRYCPSAQWIGSRGVKTNSKELGRPRQNLSTQILWVWGWVLRKMSDAAEWHIPTCFLKGGATLPWREWHHKSDWLAESDQANLIVRPIYLIELTTQAAGQRFSRFMHDQNLCQGWHKVSTILITAIVMPVTMLLRMTNKTSLVSSWSHTRDVSKSYLTFSSLQPQIGITTSVF